LRKKVFIAIVYNIPKIVTFKSEKCLSLCPPFGAAGQTFFIMDPLIPYSIPVKGLRNGTYHFDFQVDSTFFGQFEGSPVTDGNIRLELVFDKRSDLYVLQFDFKGTVKATCDRCLATIDLPVADQQQLLVKLSPEIVAEEADVIFISPELQQLNVARYAYEYIILAMPMSTVYDCENDPNANCNEEMLRYLSYEEPEEPETGNPLWEALKNLKDDNN
jgi:uncharacterized protein